ncbi:hypothetical protein [Marinibactrum halimedae]|uniref:Zinc ribbon domain-containing protein n=1 Tax=Marinibactrum halimedae TaxID=1444977 RepID=A0AA37TDL0_9GAMM|nr:hypothetical protein [Marinibactrum halimedae]MCD9461253.1 hypothetical protein [Marinibactrum halimedae]GLS28286.1 hypothetical protein GCM10007877_40060 [Marinibactrum halimedae]
MTKLYRYEGSCENYHNWVSSPTASLEPPFKECPICGVALTTFERRELIEKLNFVIEPGDYLNIKGAVTQERRYHVAIQTQLGEVLARSCERFNWESAIKELEKLHGRSGERLFKALKNKNWSVYI